MNKLDLSTEFKETWQKIKNGENIMVLRYGDGERAIMTGKKVIAQEGWESPKHVGSLGESLLKTLDFTEDENVYYGISCPCCDPEAYYWYSSRIKNKNITFANLFINSNYETFLKELKKLNREAIFIGNYRAKDRPIANFNILDYFLIDDDCFSFWETKASQMLKDIKDKYGHRNDLLYIVAAGPMSEPILMDLYQNNPKNCYLDFGSAIDSYVHDKKTRPYMTPETDYAKKICWMYKAADVNFDVSVVLSLYKRLGNLEEQLLALLNQSLKPQEILLFQDGVEDGAKVEIPRHLQDRFTLIEVSEKNVGVWGRFDFALKNATCKYVCVFDDDTIPGRRWLENCHTEMLKNVGLYGTVGIILEKAENYPFSDYLRIGWPLSNEQTAEVDFVGHSWFLKKEWLECLFTAPKSVQDLKIVGEDMSLSYQLAKYKNIKTFVPPHPSGNLDLFGSDPIKAIILGTSKEGVSLDKKSHLFMNKAVDILLADGWKILANKNPFYVLVVRHYVKLYRQKLFRFFSKIKLFK